MAIIVLFLAALAAQRVASLPLNIGAGQTCTTVAGIATCSPDVDTGDVDVIGTVGTGSAAINSFVGAAGDLVDGAVGTVANQVTRATKGVSGIISSDVGLQRRQLIADLLDDSKGVAAIPDKILNGLVNSGEVQGTAGYLDGITGAIGAPVTKP